MLEKTLSNSNICFCLKNFPFLLGCFKKAQSNRKKSKLSRGAGWKKSFMSGSEVEIVLILFMPIEKCILINSIGLS